MMRERKGQSGTDAAGIRICPRDGSETLLTGVGGLAFFLIWCYNKPYNFLKEKNNGERKEIC